MTGMRIGLGFGGARHPDALALGGGADDAVRQAPTGADRLELVVGRYVVLFRTRSHLSAKTRSLVDFLLAAFDPHRVDDDGGW